MAADFARAKQELEQTLHANTIALQLLEDSEATIKRLTRRNNELSKENTALQTELATLRTGQTSANEELEFLRARYVDLVKEKELLEKQYQADSKRWRYFKAWLLHGTGAPLSSSHELATLLSAAKTSKKRKSVSPSRSPLTGIPSLPDEDMPLLPPSRSSSELDDSHQRLDPVNTYGLSLSKLPPSIPSTIEAESPKLTSLKGNGRSDMELNDGNNTIQAPSQPNHSNSGGIGFQYEEVVRSKHERRRLEGGDCECCRDYYEAIRTFPDMPRGPVWRSPKTPTKRRRVYHSDPCTPTRSPCTSSPADGTSAKKREAVAKHKNEISRHRHQWAAPKTPPRYWDIGFPDTQEAAVINRHAEEMHRKKRK